MPPSMRLAHSSTRSAPARWATTALSTESTQISSFMGALGWTAVRSALDLRAGHLQPLHDASPLVWRRGGARAAQEGRGDVVGAALVGERRAARVAMLGELLA